MWRALKCLWAMNNDFLEEKSKNNHTKKTKLTQFNKISYNFLMYNIRFRALKPASEKKINLVIGVILCSCPPTSRSDLM